MGGGAAARKEMDGTVDILCLGEPLGEFNATADGLVFGQGGDVSNAAIAAARQGAAVGMATALGDDGVGRSFLELWEREGVSTALVRLDEDAPTGLYMIDHGPVRLCDIGPGP